jgi:transcriptional regulator with PAS, ATPase and Fis domain
LFGHERGAFTGAERRKIGKFEYASGGTLFLDEIGDMPLETQAKFLRALQEKTIQRVGGNEDIRVDVRVLCATNQHLQALIDNGKFRRDLYFRINVFPIHLPSLRQRKDDILPLAKHFLRKMKPVERKKRLLPEAEKILLSHDWPGNIRELSNAMERALIIAGNPEAITGDTFSFLLPPPSIPPDSPEYDAEYQISPGGIALEKVERDFVKQALQMSGNNQTAAARLLGLSRAKFRVLLKQLEE